MHKTTTTKTTMGLPINRTYRALFDWFGAHARHPVTAVLERVIAFDKRRHNANVVERVDDLLHAVVATVVLEPAIRAKLVAFLARVTNLCVASSGERRLVALIVFVFVFFLVSKLNC